MDWDWEAGVGVGCRRGWGVARASVRSTQASSACTTRRESPRLRQACVSCQQSALTCSGTCRRRRPASRSGHRQLQLQDADSGCDGSAPAATASARTASRACDLTANKCVRRPGGVQAGAAPCNSDCPQARSASPTPPPGAFAIVRRSTANRAGRPRCNGSCPTGFACLANAVRCGCVPCCGLPAQLRPACSGPCTDGTRATNKTSLRAAACAAVPAPTITAAARRRSATAPARWVRPAAPLPGTTQCGCQ